MTEISLKKKEEKLNASLGLISNDLHMKILLEGLITWSIGAGVSGQIK